MADLIDDLNHLAAELINAAEELELVAELATRPAEMATLLAETLRRQCEVLGSVHKLLAGTGSPLHELVRIVGGTTVSASIDRVGQFLEEHRDALRHLGARPESVERAIHILRDETRGDAFARPLTFAKDDAEGVLQTIAELRDVVCQLASAADVVSEVLTPDALRAAAEGLVGVATVIVDATTAAAAMTGTAIEPISFGWVIFRSVRSVWSGTSRVRKALGTLREAAGRIVSIRNLRAIRRLKPSDRP